MQVHFQIGQITEAPAPTVADPGLAAYRVAARRMGQARLEKVERRRRARRSKKKQSTASRLHRLLLRTGIASAALAAAAGCATLDAETAKAWKIEPVLNVTHAMQSSQAYYTMGRYHDGSQQWDKSAEAYRKAIAVDARNIEAYNALAVALARAGRHDQAETTLRQAIALDPTRAHMRSNLGYILMLAGKPAEAVVELQAAVRQDDTNPTAMANLRDALARAHPVPLAPPVAGAEPSAAPEAATAATAAGAASTLAEGARLGVLEVQVPLPITTAVVPAPLAGPINVSSPLQTASVPLPQTEAAAAPAPEVASLEGAAGDLNRPLVRQRLVRAAEPLRPMALPTEQAIRLEVSNGNGVTGMAARVGKWLGEQGIKTATLSNQKPYMQPTTTVQYRSGQEAAAQRVARSLPAPAEPASAPTEGLRSDVRVVLGRDWVKIGACVDAATCRPVDTALAAAKLER